MHSLLEDYLSHLSTQLSPLPAKRRNEEIAEMRAHLERAASSYREQGQSEEEAARSALKQFGTAQELEERIVGAWRRGEMLRKRDFWGAAICTFVTGIILGHLLDPIALPFFQRGGHFSLVTLALFYILPTCAVVGFVSGFAFPRRAVSGVLLMMAVYMIWGCVLTLIRNSANLWLFNSPFVPNIVAIVCNVIVVFAPNAVIAMLFAWLGSRWRTQRMLKKIAV